MLSLYVEGTTIGDKYRVERLLRRGGMGDVYEVRQLGTELRLAAKVLHPQLAANRVLVERFKREALAAAEIGHDNIIEVLDMGSCEDGALYLVMEHLDGEGLDSRLERERVIEPGRAATIVCDVLSALQAAHDKGILHRDIKPDNIFLARRGGSRETAKLLDFGISKFMASDAEVASRLTQSGVILGTPWYMSPEQSRGEISLTPKSDIYSMGVVLFEAITGTLPFDAPSYTALLIKVSSQPPPDPRLFHPLLPLEYAKVVTTAMARDPGKRFTSCNEFRCALLPFTRQSLPIPGRGARAVSLPPPGRFDARSSDTPLEIPAAPARGSRRIRKAVFVGLGRATEQIGLGNGGWLRIVSAPDMDCALRAIAEFAPQLVVASTAALGNLAGDLAATIRERLPSFRHPLICVDLTSRTAGLTIHEWCPEQAEYKRRFAALNRLDSAIEQLAVSDPPICARADEIKDIGYYNVVEREGETIHVQTEVTALDEICIRTIVIRSGQVIDSTERTHRSSAADIVVDSGLAARDQHSAALSRVRHGDYG